MAEIPPVFVRLKHETQSYHEAVEARVDIERCLDSRATYRALLERFWGLYAPLERVLGARADWGVWAFDYEARRKLPRLAADLGVLGVDAAGRAALPVCTELPALPTLQHAVGALYVLEGATLGGQLISRLAAERLGLTRAHGCAFFGSYGADVGAMWRSFRSFGGQVAPTDADASTVVAAATATFQLFARWLAQEEVVCAATG